MPDLTPESTPPTVPTPPAPEPPDDDPPETPPAVPPIIDPDRFEDYPVLRETFLLYISDPGSNAALRGAAELLFDLILEYWGKWPDHPEGFLRASLRAAVADIRCVQGFLAEMAEGGQDTAHEEHMAEIGGDVAREIGLQADRLEKELGTWRG